MRILIIEDERITRITLENILTKEGYSVETAADAQNGQKKAKTGEYDIIITDLRLPGGDGIEILKTSKQSNPACEVVLITAYASVQTAVSALKLGAYDYVTKPLSPEKFLALIKKIHDFKKMSYENQELRRKLNRFENNHFVAHAEPMRKLLQTIQSVAVHDYTILIEGESGTGKEVIAKAVHRESNRSDKAFVAINCAAVPESLIESELFGHEKGSFTGAADLHKGYFERAHGGTLFIDDIDDFPHHLQVNLLRVLQERQITRVGGTETIEVDVRVICATKVNLMDMVQKGSFREDLYYRLHIIPLTIPPLRDRKEDIPYLVRHFLQKHNATALSDKFSEEFYDYLNAYNWPGNVRQLENTIERIVATGDLNIPKQLSQPQHPVSGPSPEVQEKQEYPSFNEFMNQKEEEIIGWALEKAGNNVSRAAELLDLPRGTLRSKLSKRMESDLS